jgi:hypothetical protein
VVLAIVVQLALWVPPVRMVTLEIQDQLDSLVHGDYLDGQESKVPEERLASKVLLVATVVQVQLARLVKLVHQVAKGLLANKEPLVKMVEMEPRDELVIQENLAPKERLEKPDWLVHKVPKV